MSWGVTVPTTTVEEFSSAVDAATVSPTVLTPEMVEQYEYAKAVIKQIAASGILGGGPDLLLSASLNGHANTNHAPDPGWANDYLSISIYQQNPKPVTK